MTFRQTLIHAVLAILTVLAVLGGLAFLIKRVGVVLAWGLLAGGSGVGIRSFELDEKSFTAATLQQIADDTGLKLPVGAQGLHYLYWPPVDPGFMAKIEIPVAALKEVRERVAELKDNRGEMGALPVGAQVVEARTRKGADQARVLFAKIRPLSPRFSGRGRRENNALRGLSGTTIE